MEAAVDGKLSVGWVPFGGGDHAMDPVDWESVHLRRSRRSRRATRIRCSTLSPLGVECFTWERRYVSIPMLYRPVTIHLESPSFSGTTKHAGLATLDPLGEFTDSPKIEPRWGMYGLHVLVGFDGRTSG